MAARLNGGCEGRNFAPRDAKISAVRVPKLVGTLPYATPQKNQCDSNYLQPSESRTDLIRTAMQTEFVTGRQWKRIVSIDGVVCYVTSFRGN